MMLRRFLVVGFRLGSPAVRSASSYPHIVRSPFPDVVIPQTDVASLVWRDVDKWSGKTALVCGITGRSYTYGEARELSLRAAQSLLGSGLRQGQVIAAVLPNSPEAPLIALAALEAGIILTPINPLYTPEEIKTQLLVSGSVAVVTIPEKLADIEEARKRLSRENKHQSETLRTMTPDDLGFGGEAGRLTANFSPPESSDIAALPFSSGTTGLPKGVRLTHSNLIAALQQISTLGQMRPSTGDFQEVVPMLLPLFHIYGLVIITLQGLRNGCKLVTLPKFEETTFLKALKDEKATLLYVAPPLIVYLGTSPNVTKDHLKTLRLVVSGAAPCGKSDILKCLEKNPDVSYVQGYGLSECSPCVICSSYGSKKYSSVGKVLPNTSVKVVDPESGDTLSANQIGEICVNGPQVMQGYLNNPKATEEAIKDGWYHTGDVGYYDDEEDFYIVDRVKELIKVKGFQVAPAELEEVLRSHPSVLDAGVTGASDQRKGEHPVAFVVLRPNIDFSTATKEIKTFLKDKVAPYKQITEFIFTKSIPKSPSGKILRNELKKMYLNKNTS